MLISDTWQAGNKRLKRREVSVWTRLTHEEHGEVIEQVRRRCGKVKINLTENYEKVEQVIQLRTMYFFFFLARHEKGGKIKKNIQATHQES